MKNTIYHYTIKSILFDDNVSYVKNIDVLKYIAEILISRSLRYRRLLP